MVFLKNIKNLVKEANKNLVTSLEKAEEALKKQRVYEEVFENDIIVKIFKEAEDSMIEKKDELDKFELYTTMSLDTSIIEKYNKKEIERLNYEIKRTFNERNKRKKTIRESIDRLYSSEESEIDFITNKIITEQNQFKKIIDNDQILKDLIIKGRELRNKNDLYRKSAMSLILPLLSDKDLELSVKMLQDVDFLTLELKKINEEIRKRFFILDDMK